MSKDIINFSVFKEKRIAEKRYNDCENEFFELTDVIFEEWIYHDNNNTLNEFFTQQCGVAYRNYAKDIQEICAAENEKQIDGLSIHHPKATSSNPIGFIAGFFCRELGDFIFDSNI